MVFISIYVKNYYGIFTLLQIILSMNPYQLFNFYKVIPVKSDKVHEVCFLREISVKLDMSLTKLILKKIYINRLIYVFQISEITLSKLKTLPKVFPENLRKISTVKTHKRGTLEKMVAKLIPQRLRLNLR